MELDVGLHQQVPGKDPDAYRDERRIEQCRSIGPSGMGTYEGHEPRQLEEVTDQVDPIGDRWVGQWLSQADRVQVPDPIRNGRVEPDARQQQIPGEPWSRAVDPDADGDRTRHRNPEGHVQDALRQTASGEEEVDPRK